MDLYISYLNPDDGRIEDAVETMNNTITLSLGGFNTLEYLYSFSDDCDANVCRNGDTSEYNLTKFWKWITDRYRIKRFDISNLCDTFYSHMSVYRTTRKIPDWKIEDNVEGIYWIERSNILKQ